MQGITSLQLKTTGNIFLPTPTDGVVFYSHADYGDVLVRGLSQLMQTEITKAVKRYCGVMYIFIFTL
jgi:hypothetical protein